MREGKSELKVVGEQKMSEALYDEAKQLMDVSLQLLQTMDEARSRLLGLQPVSDKPSGGQVTCGSPAFVHGMSCAISQAGNVMQEAIDFIEGL